MRLLFISMGLVLTTGCSAGVPKDNATSKTTESIQLLQRDTITERTILFPNVPYRILSEANRVSDIIGEDWYELDRTDDVGFFILNPAAWSVENEAEEPCSGLPTEKLIGGLKGNTQLFLNLPGLFIGSPRDYPISKGVLGAGERLVFGPDDAYRLEASGTDFRDIDQGEKGNFHLDFFENDKFVLRLIEQSAYNDSKTEVFRILDLNDDNEPDFILSSPRHYEEYRIIIWLSGSDGYTKYEEVLSFDC